jgi:hypothetical protein
MQDELGMHFNQDACPARSNSQLDSILAAGAQVDHHQLLLAAVKPWRMR